MGADNGVAKPAFAVTSICGGRSPVAALGVCSFTTRRIAGQTLQSKRPLPSRPGCNGPLKMVFGLGAGEVGVVALVALFVFGPGKISELGRNAGGMAGSIKKATSEFQEALEESMDEADKEIEAKKKAKEGIAAAETPDEEKKRSESSKEA